MDVGEGRLAQAGVSAPLRAKNRKKEEFPGNMDNMPSGNSFPQICVVSGNNHVGNSSEIVCKFDHI
jgi:hypothetical protein